MLRNLDCDRALDRRVDMGVVEHDEGSVAAELKPDLLHRSAAWRMSNSPTVRSSR